MPNTTIHHKKNGTTYLYKIEKSYWDKNKKQPRNKQTCIGKIDPKTGNITPTTTRKNNTQQQTTTNPQITATTKTHGPNQLLTKITNQLNLTEMLKQSFPNNHQEILSLAYFITQKGHALSRCEQWSQNHTHPHNQPITSQRISELLKEITHDKRQHFLSQWLNHLIEKEYLCYDITSVSSYATSNEYVYWGYNRDHEKLPQINLAMLFGQKSRLPAYYRRMPGNISDVVTLKNTIDTLDFLGQSKLQLVLDQGFYSKNNVDALFKKQYQFILMVPIGRVWVRDIIDQYYESIASPVNYRQTISEDGGGEEVLYMVSHPYKWGEEKDGGCECFVHLFYNASRAALDFDGLTKRLVCCKEELESGKRIKEHEELYERFFIVEQSSLGGLLVFYNEDAIAKFRNRYAGFFCLLTNNVALDSLEVLEVYRRKEVVECCFDDLKNSLDMKRLRVHSSLAMDGRLFVQFLALILLSQIRVVAKNSETLRHLSAREIMEAMESVVQITYSEKYGSTISETGPLQRTIIDAFNIPQKT